MISKEEAIEILDHYLHLAYGVDPLKDNFKADRVFFSQNEYAWRIGRCVEGEEYNETGRTPFIGGGVYYITKENGAIYAIGSNPGVDWNREFIRFMKGISTIVKWNPLGLSYLECRVAEMEDYEFGTTQKKVNYETRSAETKDYLLTLLEKNKPENTLKPKIRYQPIDGIKSLITISNIGNPSAADLNNGTTKRVVEKAFIGGYEGMEKAILDVKKWIRVNGKKGVGNYWMELDEDELERPFHMWKMKLIMEIKKHRSE